MSYLISLTVNNCYRVYRSDDRGIHHDWFDGCTCDHSCCNNHLSRVHQKKVRTTELPIYVSLMLKKHLLFGLMMLLVELISLCIHMYCPFLNHLEYLKGLKLATMSLKLDGKSLQVMFPTSGMEPVQWHDGRPFNLSLGHTH